MAVPLPRPLSCARQLAPGALPPSSSTGTPFPPRPERPIGADFRTPSGTMGFSDFCRVISFPPLVVRPPGPSREPGRPGRSHQVRTSDFEPIPSPIPMRHRWTSGFAAGGQLTRRTSLTALHSRSIPVHTYCFLQTSPRGRRQRTAAHCACAGAPASRPCFVGFGFPPSGPRDRTCFCSPPI